MGKNRLGERDFDKMQDFVFGLDEIGVVVDFLKQKRERRDDNAKTVKE